MTQSPSKHARAGLGAPARHARRFYCQRNFSASFRAEARGTRDSKASTQARLPVPKMSFAAAALLRRSAATILRPAFGRRAMSGDAAEAAIEMAKWTKYSYGALAFCGVLSTYIGIVEYRHAMHPHEHEDIAYSHMKIRAKPYPGTARTAIYSKLNASATARPRRLSRFTVTNIRACILPSVERQRRVAELVGVRASPLVRPAGTSRRAHAQRPMNSRRRSARGGSPSPRRRRRRRVRAPRWHLAAIGRDVRLRLAVGRVVRRLRRVRLEGPRPRVAVVREHVRRARFERDVLQ